MNRLEQALAKAASNPPAYQRLLQAIVEQPFLRNPAKRSSQYGQYYRVLKEFLKLDALMERMKFRPDDLRSIDEAIQAIFPGEETPSLRELNEIIGSGRLFNATIGAILGRPVEPRADFRWNERTLNALVYVMEQDDSVLTEAFVLYINEGNGRVWEYLKSLPGNGAFASYDRWIQGPHVRTVRTGEIQDLSAMFDERRIEVVLDIRMHLANFYGRHPELYRILGLPVVPVQDARAAVGRVPEWEAQLRRQIEAGNIDADDADVQAIRQNFEHFLSLEESTASAAQEAGWTIELSRDFADILNLGVGFGSCLDITSGSYRGHTRAYLLDLNKRVVLVKNRAGEIVGRQSVVLTNRGIVPVSPLQNRTAMNFALPVNEFLDEFARSLPEAMFDQNPPQMGQAFSTEFYSDLTGVLGWANFPYPFRRGAVVFTPDGPQRLGVEGALQPIRFEEIRFMGLAHENEIGLEQVGVASPARSEARRDATAARLTGTPSGRAETRRAPSVTSHVPEIPFAEGQHLFVPAYSSLVHPDIGNPLDGWSRRLRLMTEQEGPARAVYGSGIQATPGVAGKVDAVFAALEDSLRAGIEGSLRFEEISASKEDPAQMIHQEVDLIGNAVQYTKQKLRIEVLPPRRDHSPALYLNRSREQYLFAKLRYDRESGEAVLLVREDALDLPPEELAEAFYWVLFGMQQVAQAGDGRLPAEEPALYEFLVHWSAGLGEDIIKTFPVGTLGRGPLTERLMKRLLYVNGGKTEPAGSVIEIRPGEIVFDPHQSVLVESAEGRVPGKMHLAPELWSALNAEQRALLTKYAFWQTPEIRAGDITGRSLWVPLGLIQSGGRLNLLRIKANGYVDEFGVAHPPDGNHYHGAGAPLFKVDMDSFGRVRLVPLNGQPWGGARRSDRDWECEMTLAFQKAGLLVPPIVGRLDRYKLEFEHEPTGALVDLVPAGAETRFRDEINIRSRRIQSAWLQGRREDCERELKELFDVMHEFGVHMRKMHDAGFTHGFAHTGNFARLPDGSFLNFDLENARWKPALSLDEALIRQIDDLRAALDSIAKEVLPDVDSLMADFDGSMCSVAFLNGYFGEQYHRIPFVQTMGFGWRDILFQDGMQTRLALSDHRAVAEVREIILARHALQPLAVDEEALRNTPPQTFPLAVNFDKAIGKLYQSYENTGRFHVAVYSDDDFRVEEAPIGGVLNELLKGPEHSEYVPFISLEGLFLTTRLSPIARKLAMQRSEMRTRARKTFETPVGRVEIEIPENPQTSLAMLDADEMVRYFHSDPEFRKLWQSWEDNDGRIIPEWGRNVMAKDAVSIFTYVASVASRIGQWRRSQGQPLTIDMLRERDRLAVLGTRLIYEAIMNSAVRPEERPLLESIRDKLYIFERDGIANNGSGEPKMDIQSARQALVDEIRGYAESHRMHPRETPLFNVMVRVVRAFAKATVDFRNYLAERDSESGDTGGDGGVIFYGVWHTLIPAIFELSPDERGIGDMFSPRVPWSWRARGRRNVYFGNVTEAVKAYRKALESSADKTAERKDLESSIGQELDFLAANGFPAAQQIKEELARSEMRIYPPLYDSDDRFQREGLPLKLYQTDPTLTRATFGISSAQDAPLGYRELLLDGVSGQVQNYLISVLPPAVEIEGHPAYWMLSVVRSDLEVLAAHVYPATMDEEGVVTVRADPMELDTQDLDRTEADRQKKRKSPFAVFGITGDDPNSGYRRLPLQALAAQDVRFDFALKLGYGDDIVWLAFPKDQNLIVHRLVDARSETRRASFKARPMIAGDVNQVFYGMRTLIEENEFDGEFKSWQGEYRYKRTKTGSKRVPADRWKRTTILTPEGEPAGVAVYERRGQTLHLLALAASEEVDETQLFEYALRSLLEKLNFDMPRFEFHLPLSQVELIGRARSLGLTVAPEPDYYPGETDGYSVSYQLGTEEHPFRSKRKELSLKVHWTWDLSKSLLSKALLIERLKDGREGWSEQDYLEHQQSLEHGYFWAENGYRELVGCLAYRQDEQSGKIEIVNFTVHPQYASASVAERLLGEFMDWALRKGNRELLADVPEGTEDQSYGGYSLAQLLRETGFEETQPGCLRFEFNQDTPVQLFLQRLTEIATRLGLVNPEKLSQFIISESSRIAHESAFTSMSMPYETSRAVNRDFLLEQTAKYLAQLIRRNLQKEAVAGRLREEHADDYRQILLLGGLLGVAVEGPSAERSELRRRKFDDVAAARRDVRYLVETCAVSDPLPEHADVLILMGNDDLSVFDAAARMHEWVDQIVISGGFGRLTAGLREAVMKSRYAQVMKNVDQKSEAEIIRDYLVARGVPVDKILLFVAEPGVHTPEAALIAEFVKAAGAPEGKIVLEDTSTNSYQNFEHTFKKLRELRIKHNTVIYMQKPVQQLRAKATFYRVAYGEKAMDLDYVPLPEEIRGFSYVDPATIPDVATMDEAALSEMIDYMTGFREADSVYVGELDKLEIYHAKGDLVKVNLAPEVLEARQRLESIPVVRSEMRAGPGAQELKRMRDEIQRRSNIWIQSDDVLRLLWQEGHLTTQRVREIFLLPTNSRTLRQMANARIDRLQAVVNSVHEIQESAASALFEADATVRPEFNVRLADSSRNAIAALVMEISRVARRMTVSDQPADMRGILNAARRVGPDFASALTADDVQHADIAAFAELVREIQRNILIPAGYVFTLPLEQGQTPRLYLGRIKDASWRRMPDYFEHPLWTADCRTQETIRTESGLPVTVAVAVGEYSFVDADLVRRDFQSFYRQLQNIIQQGEARYVPFPFRRLWHNLQQLGISTPGDYATAFAANRKRWAQIAHSRDHIYKEAYLRRHAAELSIPDGRYRSLENEALLDRVALIRSDSGLQDAPDRLDIVEGVVNFGAQLAGIINEVESYVEQARASDDPERRQRLMDLAYAAFLDFLLEQYLAVYGSAFMDGNEAVVRDSYMNYFAISASSFITGMYEQIRSQVPEEMMRAIIDRGHHDEQETTLEVIIAFIESLLGQPAEHALDLLRATYRADFYDEQERPRHLEEAPVIRKPKAAARTAVPEPDISREVRALYQQLRDAMPLPLRSGFEERRAADWLHLAREEGMDAVLDAVRKFVLRHTDKVMFPDNTIQQLVEIVRRVRSETRHDATASRVAGTSSGRAETGRKAVSSFEFKVSGFENLKLKTRNSKPTEVRSETRAKKYGISRRQFIGRVVAGGAVAGGAATFAFLGRQTEMPQPESAPSKTPEEAALMRIFLYAYNPNNRVDIQRHNLTDKDQRMIEEVESIDSDEDREIFNLNAIKAFALVWQRNLAEMEWDIYVISDVIGESADLPTERGHVSDFHRRLLQLKKRGFYMDDLLLAAKALDRRLRRDLLFPTTIRLEDSFHHILTADNVELFLRHFYSMMDHLFAPRGQFISILEPHILGFLGFGAKTNHYEAVKASDVKYVTATHPNGKRGETVVALGDGNSNGEFDFGGRVYEALMTFSKTVIIFVNSLDDDVKYFDSLLRGHNKPVAGTLEHERQKLLEGEFISPSGVVMSADEMRQTRLAQIFRHGLEHAFDRAFGTDVRNRSMDCIEIIACLAELAVKTNSYAEGVLIWLYYLSFGAINGWPGDVNGSYNLQVAKALEAGYETAVTQAGQEKPPDIVKAGSAEWNQSREIRRKTITEWIRFLGSIGKADPAKLRTLVTRQAPAVHFGNGYETVNSRIREADIQTPLCRVVKSFLIRELLAKKALWENMDASELAESLGDIYLPFKRLVWLSRKLQVEMLFFEAQAMLEKALQKVWFVEAKRFGMEPSLKVSGISDQLGEVSKKMTNADALRWVDLLIHEIQREESDAMKARIGDRSNDFRLIDLWIPEIQRKESDPMAARSGARSEIRRDATASRLDGTSSGRAEIRRDATASRLDGTSSGRAEIRRDATVSRLDGTFSGRTETRRKAVSSSKFKVSSFENLKLKTRNSKPTEVRSETRDPWMEDDDEDPMLDKSIRDLSMTTEPEDIEALTRWFHSEMGHVPEYWDWKGFFQKHFRYLCLYWAKRFNKIFINMDDLAESIELQFKFTHKEEGDIESGAVIVMIGNEGPYQIATWKQREIMQKGYVLEAQANDAAFAGFIECYISKIREAQVPNSSEADKAESDAKLKHALEGHLRELNDNLTAARPLFDGQPYNAIISLIEAIVDLRREIHSGDETTAQQVQEWLLAESRNEWSGEEEKRLNITALLHAANEVFDLTEEDEADVPPDGLVQIDFGILMRALETVMSIVDLPYFYKAQKGNDSGIKRARESLNRMINKLRNYDNRSETRRKSVGTKQSAIGSQKDKDLPPTASRQLPTELVARQVVHYYLEADQAAVAVEPIATSVLNSAKQVGVSRFVAIVRSELRQAMAESKMDEAASRAKLSTSEKHMARGALWWRQWLEEKMEG
ncbi:MAG: GNAT family N-acetyltransferase, partial [Candidatus Omnitrophica bacterium]|nr:GNAT family N-acetyltransferase [Candidatus Omnitrophota bacterium]